MADQTKADKLRNAYYALLKFHPAVRRAAIILIQTGIAAVSYFLAYLLRFDFSLPDNYFDVFLFTLPILLVIRLATFFHRHFFSSLWRYTTLGDIVNIIKVNLVGSMLFGGVLIIFHGRTFFGVPRSVFIIDFILCTVGIVLMRIIVKKGHDQFLREQREKSAAPVRTLIIDARPQAVRLAREILENPLLNYKLIGFLDDDNVRQKSNILSLPVLGATGDLAAVIAEHNIDEVLAVLPDEDSAQAARLREICYTNNVRIKLLPTTESQIEHLPLTSQMRISELEPSMGRELIYEQTGEQVRADYGGKVILVTGAAGSIGSELCRQIVMKSPKKLLALDQNESGLYDIGQALGRLNPEAEIELVVGDITNQAKVQAVFKALRPDYVFHTAAYKHVPMMENEPIEAITTNVGGTYNVALAAQEYGCECFVYISTDKAVNPESVMGRTKYVAEQLVAGLNGGKCRNICVRFGNVLESAGSVLPLFRNQVEQGGPVTVTHPEVTRYFMSISEAVYLILVSAEIGKGGEVFLLKMGNPIKILELAKRVITAAGMLPDEEIKIVFTGLRPGERIHEPLYWEGEDICETLHPHINVMTRRQPNAALITRWIKDTEPLCQAMDKQAAEGELERFTRQLIKS